MVLTVSFVISPAIGFLVTVIGRSLPANLTPASRRQDHTTSPSASHAVRQQHVSVHRIPPRVRDDRETPLIRGGTCSLYYCFYQFGKRFIFRKRARHKNATQACRANHLPLDRQIRPTI